jgi:hypothetical protein
MVLVIEFFLSPRALYRYLLLWKWRRGDGFGQAQLFFWLRSIAAQAPAAAVFVVGTHRYTVLVLEIVHD